MTDTDELNVGHVIGRRYFLGADIKVYAGEGLFIASDVKFQLLDFVNYLFDSNSIQDLNKPEYASPYNGKQSNQSKNYNNSLYIYPEFGKLLEISEFRLLFYDRYY